MENGNSGHILCTLLHTFTKILYYTFELVYDFYKLLKNKCDSKLSTVLEQTTIL